jgi:hypothetical protein
MLFGTQCAFLPLENPDKQPVSFQKLTQLSQGNNVLVAHASSTDSFLSRDTRVSSIQLKKPVSNKMSGSNP